MPAFRKLLALIPAGALLMIAGCSNSTGDYASLNAVPSRDDAVYAGDTMSLGLVTMIAEERAIERRP